MQLPNQTTGQTPPKDTSTTKTEQSTPPKYTTKQFLFNPQALGKAGNNAIQIMVAQGHFKGDKTLDNEMKVYKELTNQIYRTDRELENEIKQQS